MESELSTMTESEYYFGVKFSEWENLMYFDAIVKRLEFARELYFKLIEEERNTKGQMSFKKRERLWKVEKALRDQEKLINEKNSIV